MHTVFALLCFVVVIHWLIFPYPPGLLHWHCGNLTIAPVPAKQPWWIWINTSCEFIMNDCITTTKQSTTKLCAYFLGYTIVTKDCYKMLHNPWQLCYYSLGKFVIFRLSVIGWKPHNIIVKDFQFWMKSVERSIEYTWLMALMAWNIYWSGHQGVAFLLLGFDLIWQQNNVTRQSHHDDLIQLVQPDRFRWNFGWG